MNKTYKKKPTKYQRELKSKNITLAIFILMFSIFSLGSMINGLALNKVADTNNKIIETQEVIIEKVETAQVVVEEIKLNTNQPEVEFQIRTLARSEGFKWEDYLVRLAMCESSLNPAAVSKPNRNGTVDYGLFQFNSKHAPLSSMTKECAMSIECSTKETIKAINAGMQHHWSCDKIIRNK